MTTEKTVEEMIEALAIAVNSGFVDVTEDLKDIKERLDRIELRLDKIEFSSGNLDPRVTVLEQKMLIVGTKLGLQS